ncbi:hypothetical protein KUV85_05995 [Nocardioides panacisoli]|uniref:hypothetical protein n=1 Tax=Nocardioides panacisoli TaxID=627624 RepID=UPI001C626031|nr:hypothetical protein [Nocardioides panacisoli]QYJ05230.1 hypothetical protein KUV85_05995 [Nocardioides panacisoli]
MTRPYVPAGILALLLTMLLSACGEDAPATDPSGLASLSKPTAEPSAPTTLPATTDPASPVVTAYTTWLAGLATENAMATCDQHAPALTIDLRQRAIIEGRAQQGDPCEDFVALLWESPDVETEPMSIEVTQETAEDALLAVDFPGADQTVRMVNRYGSWYVESTTPREAGPERWLDAWCSLEVGADRGEVIEAMGTPSGEYTVANGGEPQLWWAAGPYDFRAYLDLRGTVTELVADHDALSAEDRDRLDCPELRNRTNS